MLRSSNYRPSTRFPALPRNPRNRNTKKENPCHKYLKIKKIKEVIKMADNNDNNDDNNNAEEQEVDDPDFLYRFNNSTYCIFCDNSTIAIEYTLQLWDHPDLEPSFPLLEMDSTVISSSLGLLLCYTPLTYTYFVGNPFTNLPYMWSRPRLRHITDTQSVLVADSNGYFHIISLIPTPTQQGIKCAIEIYSSHLGKWMTLSQGLWLKVVPNSGISCRRYGYWLIKSSGTNNIVWVVRVDTKPNVMESPVLDYVQFRGVDEQDVVAGMKLGRVGNQVGIVIVNETKRRVELHILNEEESVNGNEDDGSTDMIRWELFAEVHVDVDPTMDEAVVEIMEPLRIRCREMPQPIKFESGKMEVLLLVGGRLVVWQNGWNQESRTVAKVVSCEVPYDADPINGVSHVASSIEFRVQDKQINDVPNVASSVVPWE